MPKAGRSVRRRGKFHARYVDALLSLGTLANNTSIVGDLTANAERDLWMHSIDIMVGWKGATIGEAPIEVFVMNGVYTTVELEEYIENTSDLDIGNLVTNEVKNRAIRSIGMLPIAATSGVHNEGRPRRIKLRMPLVEGEALAVAAYNRSGGSLTTGNSLRFSGKVYFSEKSY